MSKNGHNGEGLPGSLAAFMLSHLNMHGDPGEYIQLPEQPFHSVPPEFHRNVPPELPAETTEGKTLKAMLDGGMSLDEAAAVLKSLGENSTGIPPEFHRTIVKDPVAEKRRAYDRERKARKKLAAKNAAGNSTGIPDSKNVDTLKEIKIDTEEEVKERKKVRAVILYTADFEIFWAAYPRRPNMGKAETFAVWKKISPEERQLATEAAPKFDAWVKTQKPDYTVLHACRFLSKRRADAFQAEPPSKTNNLNIPPWEREGITEDEWLKRRGENA